MTNRGIIDAYIKKLLPDAHIILSEEVWENGFDKNIDLLTFEDFLAEVSDSIILFVESPGSFCELGAFTYVDEIFSKKLIIALDERYQHSSSFITTGPVLKAQNNGAHIAYTQVNSGAILSSTSFRKTINTLAATAQQQYSIFNRRFINKDSAAVHLNSFILEILELLKMSEPITQADLIELYKSIKGFGRFSFVKKDGTPFGREIKISYITKLLEISGIITTSSSLLSLKQRDKIQSFMLNYTENSFEKERSKIICRKYRYGGALWQLS